MAVDDANRGVPIFIDARDVTAPFTPGALRGGTHAHAWSGDGKWISFTYQDAALIPVRRERCERSNAALRAAYERLTPDGVGNLHCVPGRDLLGSDGEATVDGAHFTDLGFMRMADALEGVLRPLV